MRVRPRCLCADQLQVERDCYSACDLVLQREQIVQIAVKPLRPQMSVALSVNQLSGHTDLISPPTHAPFQRVAHSKLAADLFRVDMPVPISECRVARDDEHVCDP